MVSLQIIRIGIKGKELTKEYTRWIIKGTLVEFLPTTYTLGTLRPAVLVGGDLRCLPAAVVPQVKHAILVRLSSGLRESCG